MEPLVVVEPKIAVEAAHGVSDRLVIVEIDLLPFDRTVMLPDAWAGRIAPTVSPMTSKPLESQSMRKWPSCWMPPDGGPRQVDRAVALATGNHLDRGTDTLRVAVLTFGSTRKSKVSLAPTSWAIQSFRHTLSLQQ